MIEMNQSSWVIKTGVLVDSMRSDGRTGTQLRTGKVKYCDKKLSLFTDKGDLKKSPLIFIEFLLHARYHTCVTPGLCSVKCLLRDE